MARCHVDQVLSCPSLLLAQSNSHSCCSRYSSPLVPAPPPFSPACKLCSLHTSWLPVDSYAPSRAPPCAPPPQYTCPSSLPHPLPAGCSRGVSAAAGQGCQQQQQQPPPLPARESPSFLKPLPCITTAAPHSVLMQSLPFATCSPRLPACRMLWRSQCSSWSRLPAAAAAAAALFPSTLPLPRFLTSPSAARPFSPSARPACASCPPPFLIVPLHHPRGPHCTSTRALASQPTHPPQHTPLPPLQDVVEESVQQLVKAASSSSSSSSGSTAAVVSADSALELLLQAMQTAGELIAWGGPGGGGGCAYEVIEE
jgi:hypothetical protein